MLTLEDGRDVVVSLLIWLTMEQVLEYKDDPYALARMYEDVYVGVSQNVAIYVMSVYEYNFIRTRANDIVPMNTRATIRLKATRFCKLTWHTGQVFYSFGNMGGNAPPIIVRVEDVTPELNDLIGVKLKNVVLEYFLGVVTLIQWELRVYDS